MLPEKRLIFLKGKGSEWCKTEILKATAENNKTYLRFGLDMFLFWILFFADRFIAHVTQADPAHRVWACHFLYQSTHIPCQGHFFLSSLELRLASRYFHSAMSKVLAGFPLLNTSYILWNLRTSELTFSCATLLQNVCFLSSSFLFLLKPPIPLYWCGCGFRSTLFVVNEALSIMEEFEAWSWKSK